MLKTTLIAILLLLTAFAEAQNKFTISGYIKDSLSGETLIGAAISVNEKTYGVNSNQYGFFSITLAEGSYKISCSFVGYRSREINLELKKNENINFSLAPK